MIAHAIVVSVPFKWVAGDTVYGVGDIEQQLRRAGKGYVVAREDRFRARRLNESGR
jgi:SRSO17 transposase